MGDSSLPVFSAVVWCLKKDIGNHFCISSAPTTIVIIPMMVVYFICVEYSYLVVVLQVFICCDKYRFSTFTTACDPLKSGHYYTKNMKGYVMKRSMLFFAALIVTSAMFFSCQDAILPPSIIGKVTTAEEVPPDLASHPPGISFPLIVPQNDSLEKLDSPTCQIAWLLSGFYHPFANGDDRITAGFKASGCSGSSTYTSGRYHLGTDITSPAGYGTQNRPIYALSEGRVTWISRNGWEYSNIAYVIRHWTSDGRPFLAIYGHIIPSMMNKSVNDTVRAGEFIGRVGMHPNGPHLHLGIYPNGTVLYPQLVGWGFLPCSSWPNDNGFVDPFNWLLSKRPSLRCPDPVDNQAKLDMEGFIVRFQQSLFGPPFAGVFAKNLNWDPNYELRAQAFMWGSSSCKVSYVYSIRSKTTSGIRYVSYLNPDTGITSSWVRVTW